MKKIAEHIKDHKDGTWTHLVLVQTDEGYRHDISVHNGRPEPEPLTESELFADLAPMVMRCAALGMVAPRVGQKPILFEHSTLVSSKEALQLQGAWRS